MTLDSAAIGTVIQVGHPGNGLTATKRPDGVWYSNLDGASLDLDPRDVTAVLYSPQPGNIAASIAAEGL